MTTESDTIELPGGVRLDEGELVMTASRSSGPGGQNVNKVASRVTLSLDLEATTAFTAEQQEKIRQRLGSRITKAGLLRVSAQRERSQARNRDLARERLIALLDDALTDDPRRVRTRVPRSAKRRRLQAKRQRSERKKERSRRYRPDD